MSRLEKYDLIINYFENEIVDVAKKELNIRIRYISSKIQKEKNYENDLQIIIEDGDLLNLLCFIEYKENNKFVKFLLKCSEILNETFSKYSKLEFLDNDEICIKRSAAILIQILKKDTELIKLASVKRTLSFKHSILNNFFEKAAESSSLYKAEKLKLSTSETSILKLEQNKPPVFSKENNTYLIDSNKLIKKKVINLLNNFKSENLKDLNFNIKSSKQTIKEFKNSYPAFEIEEQNSFDSILALIKSIDSKAKKIDFKQSFDDIAFNEAEQETYMLVKKGVKMAGGTANSIKVLAKKIGLKKANEIVNKYA